MYQALGILPVIDGADTRNPAEEKSEARGHIGKGNGPALWSRAKGSAPRHSRTGRSSGEGLRPGERRGAGRSPWASPGCRTRGRGHVLRAKNRAEGIATAFVAHRLTAGPAICRGRHFRMILAIHNVSLNLVLPTDFKVALRR